MEDEKSVSTALEALLCSEMPECTNRRRGAEDRATSEDDRNVTGRIKPNPSTVVALQIKARTDTLR